MKPVQDSGTLPIICESIAHVSIGCVSARSKLQKGLDSYQEEDLADLRNKWTDALAKRRDYLDEQLQKIMNKEGKWLKPRRRYLYTLDSNQVHPLPFVVPGILLLIVHFSVNQSNVLMLMT